MVSRGNTAYIPYTILAASLLILLPASVVAVIHDVPQREELVIAGTGDSEELLRELAREFERSNLGIRVRVPDSVGSTGGIRMVSAGEADVARVARSLKEDERAREEDLTYMVFAWSPVVFAVHPAVEGVDGLSREEIFGIFSGKYANWQQLGGETGKIYSVHRERGDSCRETIDVMMPGFGNMDEEASIVIYSAAEAVHAIENNEGTIGYLSYAMVAKTNLKVLKVDGNYPSAHNVRRGKYRLVEPLGLVYKGEASPLVGKFINFLYGSAAKRIIEQYGSLPVKKPGI